jgi:hypothetical protein
MNDTTPSTASRSQRWQLAGIVLWRGGIAFVAAYGFYYGAWQLLRQLNWPPQLISGAAIALGGFGLLMVSLILDRRRAADREGYLLDDTVRGGDD